ncbi:interleukin-8 [Anolis carolinensis]|uniref:Chemokine interleukin-8-like domain-containing protein n=1 Tax=Anolis carolinensis TaxID=28377 RepID=A0A803TBM9_ANOCA|nr:PREDICTED: interleukin-8 [Anolis carolinensis]|eukprot:XP_008110346.1 PREDICTED: interleukin-8 [Anolis carolinensis]
MGSRHLILWVLLLALHITAASIFDPTVNESCKCLRVRSEFINPTKFARVEILPAGILCQRMEIIITLKGNRKVCVNPESKWVQVLVKLIQNTNETSP